MTQKYVVVMVKEPRPGRVKTRLGRDLGMVVAAWWFRHQCARLLRRLEDPRWSLRLAVTPDVEGMNSRVWPRKFQRLPQGTGDLGHRMARVFRGLPPGPAVIVGADIPGLTSSHIARAFHRLGDHDAVLGPAPDGGYWLIGLKRVRPVPTRFLRDVRWSGPWARADTEATLDGLRFAYADTLNDVDMAADLSA